MYRDQLTGESTRGEERRTPSSTAPLEPRPCTLTIPFPGAATSDGTEPPPCPLEVVPCGQLMSARPR